MISGKHTKFFQNTYILQISRNPLFEQYLLREINLDTYKARKADCDSRLIKTKNAYAALAARAKQVQGEQAEQAKRQQIIREISDADSLTPSLADLLIEKVYVFPGKHVEISYKVRDFNA